MDRRERYDDFVEAVRVAMDGRLSELWTAMPCIVESYDAEAETITAQPAVRGRVLQPDGSETLVALPLLVDVPAIFPGAGGFTLTFPVKAGDECLVVFASRCIDAWWQSGGVGNPLETRQHDLSDGFAFVGPRCRARALDGVSTENVQLRTDDGKASVTMRPDYTIVAANPAASVSLTPAGEVAAVATARISLRAPDVIIAANSLSMTNLEGGAVAANIVGDINQTGSITSSGDHEAGGVSLVHHVHEGVEAGGDNTGEPI
ncbi:MAG: Gp138 family membrane-puncturing spike protein [Pseudodesulfovibrio sp.]|nr:Gp138 family membrane-puncturing spike protein [Pseudodesulfovibrio sp.]